MSNLLQSNDMLSSENEESAAHCIQEDSNNEQKSPENTHDEEEQASNILGVTSEKPPVLQNQTLRIHPFSRLESLIKTVLRKKLQEEVTLLYILLKKSRTTLLSMVKQAMLMAWKVLMRI